MKRLRIECPGSERRATGLVFKWVRNCCIVLFLSCCSENGAFAETCIFEAGIFRFETREAVFTYTVTNLSTQVTETYDGGSMVFRCEDYASDAINVKIAFKSISLKDIRVGEEDIVPEAFEPFEVTMNGKFLDGARFMIARKGNVIWPLNVREYTSGEEYAETWRDLEVYCPSQDKGLQLSAKLLIHLGFVQAPKRADGWLGCVFVYADAALPILALHADAVTAEDLPFQAWHPVELNEQTVKASGIADQRPARLQLTVSKLSNVETVRGLVFTEGFDLFKKVGIPLKNASIVISRKRFDGRSFQLQRERTTCGFPINYSATLRLSGQYQLTRLVSW